MKCYSEGDLRSYLDRELPPGAIAAIAAHISGCRPCAASLSTLSARAQYVSSLLGELGELGELSGAGASACQPALRWLPAAALAAALALLFILLPKPHHPAPAPPIPIAAVAPATQPVRLAAVAPATQRARARKRALPRKPKPQYFLALDNEPFEVGVVRRVAFGPDELPADVVFSPDGRPRAIRLVSDSQN